MKFINLLNSIINPGLFIQYFVNRALVEYDFDTDLFCFTVEPSIQILILLQHRDKIILQLYIQTDLPLKVKVRGNMFLYL